MFLWCLKIIWQMFIGCLTTLICFELLLYSTTYVILGLTDFFGFGDDDEEI